VVAGRHELETLMRVPGEEGRGIVHIAPGDQYRWFLELNPPLTSTVNWSAILSYRPGSTTRTPYTTKLADLTSHHQAGMDVWAQVTCLPIRQSLSMARPAPFSPVAIFAEVFDLDPVEQLARYSDPAWRRKAATDLAASTIPVVFEAVTVEESPNRPDLVGRTVAALAEEWGVEPFDALCEVAVGDKLETRFSITFANDDQAAVTELLTGEGCIMGLSDAGAHLTQICDAVMPVDFLSRWVRDRSVMSIEQGIRKLTGELGRVLGIDRGVLVEGRPADLVVLDWDALAVGPVHRVADMPAGGERLVADRPQGIDAVVVNGVPIRRDGQAAPDRLERAPGRILRPAAA
jgi:N-acyl-D-aspartate/D-glutamate deacylase